MNEKGFTLIEILVIIAILSIIAGATYSSLVLIVPQLNIHGFTELLISDIRQTSRLAIENQENHTICFSALNRKYWIVEGVDCSVSNKILEKTLPTGVEFSEINIPSQKAEFNPYGSVKQAGSLSVSLKGELKIIQIRPSGFIKVAN